MNAQEVVPSAHVQLLPPAVEKESEMAMIALLDDDPLQARLIIDNLTMMNYNVLWAQQCWEGLLIVHRVRPDLVLLDCAVPQWIEFVTMLRALRGFRKIPVLLICANRPPSSLCKKLGIVGYIEKSFSAETLVEQVQQVISPMIPLSNIDHQNR